MLRLQSQDVDIFKVSSLISKYGIRSQISEEFITLYGNIPHKLLEEIFNNTIQNLKYESEIYETTNIHKYNLIYSTVKRGQVYICDFNTPLGSEQGYIRHAIVVQNDNGNLFSPTTIVLPCTTEHKKNIPTHYKFVFSSSNMIDYSNYRVRSTKENTILAEQIRTVDKSRLRKYIGTMTPEFMDKIQKIIDISLALKRK